VIPPSLVFPAQTLNCLGRGWQRRKFYGANTRPHFLHANQSYLNSVSGLRPDPEKHSFYFDVQPTTGTTLSAKARIQINMAIKRNTAFSAISQVITYRRQCICKFCKYLIRLDAKHLSRATLRFKLDPSTVVNRLLILIKLIKLF